MSFIAEQNRYRPDIDGLRALAVTIVVLFHAEVPGFPGGFVGVDVFFVISGFLITGILARSFTAGTFSLVEFYERRARRILPALFVMVLGVIAAAPFIIRPWDIAAVGRSVKYVATSVANVDFHRTLSGYSGDDASLTPLLHMWSLSVEEQFYIITPFLWLVLSKFTRNHSHWLKLFAATTIASFALTAWMITRDQSACFFLLPYRAWELAAGGLLALAPRPVIGPNTSRVFGIAGLGMILASTFCFSEDTTFPGPWALLPCAGAILVILAGLSESPSFPTTLLRARPVVFVGLISYSVYLLHWPVLVFVHYHEQYSGTEMAWWGMAILIALIFVGGWLSWRYIESPFRKAGKWTRKRVFVSATTGIITIFGFGYFLQKTPLLIKLLPVGAEEIAAFRFSKNPINEGSNTHQKANDARRYGSPEGEPDTVLWGDSHAGMLVHPLEEVALGKNRSFLFQGCVGTPPVKGIVCGSDFRSRDNADYSNEVYELLVQDKTIRNVILAARWALYTEGYAWAYGPAEKSKKSRNSIISAPGNPPVGSPGVRAELAKALEETVIGLVESGKTVYLVYPVPELAYALPQVLANEVIEGRDPAKFTISAKGVYFDRTAPLVAMMDALPESEGLIRIRPEKLLIEGGLIRLMDKGKPLYCDDDHLSIEGGRYIMPLFEGLF